ncbi:hypothetical protein BHM03_00037824 [Ensete ventricosum]|nr:hypothetical protein BHM03_00037824 [Ensete ventricosum]
MDTCITPTPEHATSVRCCAVVGEKEIGRADRKRNEHATGTASDRCNRRCVLTLFCQPTYQGTTYACRWLFGSTSVFVFAPTQQYICADDQPSIRVLGERIAFASATALPTTVSLAGPARCACDGNVAGTCNGTQHQTTAV